MLMDGPEVIGHLAVTIGESDTEEVMIFIQEGFRGKGIGSQALKYVGNLLAKEGGKRLWLTVRSENTQAVRCFKKAGFRFTCHEIQPEMEMVMDSPRRMIPRPEVRLRLALSEAIP